MTVHRLALYRSDDPYTRVPNVTVNDDRLDLKALGLLVFMLSKPDGWTFRERALASQVGVSREQIRTALARLTEAGYVVRRRELENGIPKVVTEVYDVPKSEGPETVPAGVRKPDRRETGPVSNERDGARTTRRVVKPRDGLFETMVAVCGHDPKRLTASERGRINKALKDLREVGVTPDEIRSAAKVYRSKYPNAALTPTALSAHWSTLQRRNVTATPTVDPELEAIRNSERETW